MTMGLAATRLSRAAFLFGLASLAWIGVGLVHFGTGRDVGAGFQPAYLAFAVALVCALPDPAFRRRLFSAPPGRLIWLGACAAILISWFGIRTTEIDIPASLAHMRFWKQLIQWMVMAAIALVTYARLHTDRDWSEARIALAIGVGLQFFYGIIQVFDYGHPLVWFATTERFFTSNPAILAGSEELYLGHGFRAIPRVRGTACEPLYLANLMLLCLPWFVAWGLCSRRWLVIAGMSALLLFATWSRGAWLAGVAALVLAFLLAWKVRALPSRRTLVGMVIGLLLCVILLLAFLGIETVLLPVRRLIQSGSLWDWSNLTRVYSMQAAWRAFLAEPLFGVGWGQFAFNFYVLVDIEGIQSQFDWPVVNNILLLVLGETGLLGFTIFTTGVVVLLRRTWAGLIPLNLGERLGRRRLNLVAATVAVVGVWLQLLTFSQYNLPHIWVALGMWFASLDTRDVADQGERA